MRRRTGEHYVVAEAVSSQRHTLLYQSSGKNKKGKASFNVLGPVVTVGDEITTTATNVSTGGTSEFSDEVTVVAAS